MRATSTSVVSPVSNSATNFTRHTSFGTSSPSSREPKIYRSRNKPHKFAWSQPISTAFVESSVNEIIAKRMNKKQQMRWNRATVQPFLDVRTAVLNDTLEDAFRHRYPGFRPANGNEAVALVA